MHFSMSPVSFMFIYMHRPSRQGQGYILKWVERERMCACVWGGEGEGDIGQQDKRGKVLVIGQAIAKDEG